MGGLQFCKGSGKYAHSTTPHHSPSSRLKIHHRDAIYTSNQGNQPICFNQKKPAGAGNSLPLSKG